MSLSDTIWWSKKARIHAEKRLSAHDLFSQLLLFWYSFFTVVVSILEIKSESSNEYFVIVMVSLSILILCSSLFISSRRFQERATLLKQCYESLGELEHKAKQQDVNINELSELYKATLSSSENHQDIDFKLALVNEYMSSKAPEKDLSRQPTKANFVEVTMHFLFTWLIRFAVFLFPFAVLFYLR